MTISFKFSNQQDKDEFKNYINEIYEYIDIDSEHIPGAIQESDLELIVYFTDEFFNYGYKFFIEQFIMSLNGSPNDRKYLELIARYFRMGSEEFLMHNIVLDK